MNAPADGFSGEPPFVWDLEGLPADAPPEIPDHELLGPLGQGGMGVVYRARQLSLGREVAVKVLPLGGMTERSRKRFHREAQLLARFQHPNVLAVHASGETAQTCYLVSELVHGRHLDVVCEGAPVERRLQLLEELAEAVSALHDADIVHRDLKPSNILVTEEGRVKVIDFGVSTGEGVTRLTSTGNFVGTPLYAAPERFGGLHGDSPPADVWALGVIAYQVLAGAHPFSVTTQMNLTELIARMQMPLAPLQEMNPEVSEAVAAVVARALTPARKERTPDARAFAEDLRQARAAGRGGSRLLPRLALGVACLLLAGALGLLLTPWGSPPQQGSGGVAPVPSTATIETPRKPAPFAPGPVRALAMQGRWAEVRASVPDDVEAPTAVRLRGLARLYLEGPAAAQRDLGGDDPAVLHEEALREARSALEQPEAPLRSVFGNSGSLADRIRGCPEAGPARAEASRRSAAWLLDALRIAAEDPTREGSLGSEALEGASTALLPFAPDPAAVHLHVLLALHARQLQRPKGLKTFSQLVKEQPFEGYQGPLEGVAHQLRLVVARENKTEAFDPLLRSRAQDALGSPCPKGVVYEHVLRRCRAELALIDRDEGIALLRAGEDAQGRERLARGLEHARSVATLAQGVALTSFERTLQASLELTCGDPAKARALLVLEPEGLSRSCLLAECDLVEGRLDSLRQGWREFFRGQGRVALRSAGVPYQRQHRLLLLGRATPAQVEARLAEEGALAAGIFVPMEWRTPDGFRAVLRGGWWPGAARAPKVR